MNTPFLYFIYTILSHSLVLAAESTHRLRPHPWAVSEACHTCADQSNGALRQTTNSGDCKVVRYEHRHQ